MNATAPMAIAAITGRPVIPWACEPRARRPCARRFQNRPAMYSTDTATSGKPQLFSPPGRSRVHDGVRILLIVCVGAALACGRTALEPPDDPSRADAAADHPRDLAAARIDAPPDITPDLPLERPPDLPPDRITCVPTGD